ncbi:MAG: YmaF family protein [Bacteroidota bacterium]
MDFTQTLNQVGFQSCPETVSHSNINPYKETKNLEYPRPSEVTCQTHVHEFQGSTKLAERGEDRHNHRFAGVSGQAIPYGNSHIHCVFANTDFFKEHLHGINVVSGPAIEVGGGKHVHFVKHITTFDDGHFHEFQFAFLIEDPSS